MLHIAYLKKLSGAHTIEVYIDCIILKVAQELMTVWEVGVQVLSIIYLRNFELLS